MKQPTEEQLIALREAWLDVPWNGFVPKGAGAFMSKLVNAVTAIVDPDRQLREDPIARARGDVASLKSQLEFTRDGVRIAEEWVDSGLDACRAALDRLKAEVATLEAQLSEKIRTEMAELEAILAST